MRETATYFEQRPAQKDNEWQAIVLWLNGEDDPGFGTLKLLARRPKPRLIAVDLLALLKKLDEHALVLNVLRPLLVAEEQTVRDNVVQWVKNIRQTPNLNQGMEDRLITIMSQLIEQKFRTLTYKELSQMLKLTPLRETSSVQEVIKEELVGLLTRHIQRKFTLSEALTADLIVALERLEANQLEALFDQILDIDTYEVLEQWIDKRLPAEVA